MGHCVIALFLQTRHFQIGNCLSSGTQMYRWVQQSISENYKQTAREGLPSTMD